MTLTPEAKALLGYASGLEEGPMELIEFVGAETRLYYAPLEGRTLQIAPDGFGNAWCYWSSSIDAGLGPILYYMHEGPILLYQSRGIVDFVEECLHFMRPPYTSLIDDVHEFRLKSISRLNDDLKSADAIRSASPDLSDFVASVSDDALFYDFRNAEPGDGLDLGALHVVAIHPRWPVFAVRRRKGLIARISSLFQR